MLFYLFKVFIDANKIKIFYNENGFCYELNRHCKECLKISCPFPKWLLLFGKYEFARQIGVIVGYLLVI